MKKLLLIALLIGFSSPATSKDIKYTDTTCLDNYDYIVDLIYGEAPSIVLEKFVEEEQFEFNRNGKSSQILWHIFQLAYGIKGDRKRDFPDHNMKRKDWEYHATVYCAMMYEEFPIKR